MQWLYIRILCFNIQMLSVHLLRSGCYVTLMDIRYMTASNKTFQFPHSKRIVFYYISIPPNCPGFAGTVPGVDVSPGEWRLCPSTWLQWLPGKHALQRAPAPPTLRLVHGVWCPACRKHSCVIVTGSRCSEMPAVSHTQWLVTEPASSSAVMLYGTQAQEVGRSHGRGELGGNWFLTALLKRGFWLLCLKEPEGGNTERPVFLLVMLDAGLMPEWQGESHCVCETAGISEHQLPAMLEGNRVTVCDEGDTNGRGQMWGTLMAGDRWGGHWLKLCVK